MRWLEYSTVFDQGMVFLRLTDEGGVAVSRSGGNPYATIEPWKTTATIEATRARRLIDDVIAAKLEAKPQFKDLLRPGEQVLSIKVGSGDATLVTRHYRFNEIHGDLVTIAAALDALVVELRPKGKR